MNYQERFLVFTLVQDWIFEDNLSLYIENANLMQRNNDLNVELTGLENAFVAMAQELRVANANFVAMQLRLRHAEDRANDYHTRYLRVMDACDCHDCERARRRRRIELVFAESTESEGYESEMLEDDEI